MKNKIVAWIMMAFFAGLLHGCSWGGVETGNPINELTEGAYLFTADGSVHYSFEMTSSGKAIIKKINDDGDIEEEVEADMTIDEEKNSFTVSASFSDGTEVVVYGYLNDAGDVLSIQISVNDVTISFDVCLYTSENSNVITIKACTEQDMGDNMGGSVPGEEGGSTGEDNQDDQSGGGASDDNDYTDIYWVSANEGSDNNPGTIDEPFQTITKALETSQNEETYKDVNVVAGDYEESLPTISSGIGIYGGYGELTADGTRERDIENNQTNVQLDSCGISSYELTHGDIVAISGFNLTAPGMVFCIYVSIDIMNNHIHATLSDQYYINAVYINSSEEGATLYANIEDNVITVDDNWLEDINTSTKGIGFYTTGSGASGSLNLKNNEITVGNGRGDSWGIMVSQTDAASAYFVATGNTIQTGSAGRNTSPILLSSLSGEGYTSGGTAIIERNILIAGDVDQSVSGEYQVYGAGSAGIQAWGFGESSLISNNIIATGSHADHSWGIALGYGNNFGVYNNTIVATESIEGASCHGILLYEDSVLRARNNIICADGGEGIDKDTSATILSLTSNLFCNGMNNLVSGYEGEDYIAYETISELALTSFADDSNLIGDPKFVDESGHDLHLSSGSAAIDAGENYGVYDDIDGEARPKGSGYDIGADEY